MENLLYILLLISSFQLFGHQIRQSRALLPWVYEPEKTIYIEGIISEVETDSCRLVPFTFDSLSDYERSILTLPPKNILVKPLVNGATRQDTIEWKAQKREELLAKMHKYRKKSIKDHLERGVDTVCGPTRFYIAPQIILY